MSYGLKLINANSYLTFDENKTYYQFQEKLTSTQATVMFSQRFYWDTVYTGSKFPLVFIYSNGYWCSIINTQRLSGNNWRVHVWCEGTKATDTKNNITGYVFTESSESSTNPSWGIKIKDSSGARIYDSDFNLMRIKDFVTMPAPQDAYAGCNSTRVAASAAGVSQSNSTAHGITFPTGGKPTALLYSNGFQISRCDDHGCVYYPPSYPFPARYFCAQRTGWKTVQKVTSTSVEHGWGNIGAASYALRDNHYDSSDKTTPEAYVCPILNGADYD